MSDIAKDRLLAVGARFASYEHANKDTSNDQQLESGTMNPNAPTLSSGGGSKMSFWKKNSGKVPGRLVYGAQHPPLHAADAHLATYIKGKGAANKKNNSSFQEFEGSTLDAWDEDENDPLQVTPALASPPKTPTDTAGVGHHPFNEQKAEELVRPPLQHLSSTEESSERHPQAAPGGGGGGKTSKAGQLKNAMVSKFSERLGKGNRGKQTTPAALSQAPPQRQLSGENYIHAPQPHSPIRMSNISDLQDQENSRLEKFGKLLSGPTTDLDQLRKMTWNGVSNVLRGTTWRLLSGYLPPTIDRRQATLERKQAEYHNFVQQYYPTRHDPLHQETYRQIHIDIPRTNPLIPIFQQEVVQELFERILFIWAIRHPASGYVQGINDLVVPFFVVFLSEHIEKDVETYNINNVPKEVLDMVEADTFWCMSKLLDGIQDNYTFAQPGIQMKVNKLQNLVMRIDNRMHEHILNNGIDYLQFTFRWMNNLLMRELPLRASIRLWDTYWSEPDGFAIFHLYVCAALLTLFSKEIMEKEDFQTLMVVSTEPSVSRLEGR
uniref:Rab-GAP TBC domain-containing protein n=1 Tax=Clytia hemisphaerica TaxID=252671 RepID=A0A7M6DPU5_9CNID